MGSANSTADKALQLLLMFDDDSPTLSAGAIADHLKMPRSTAYRYLSSLRSIGLLVDAGESTYRLGPKIFELARIARRSYSILQIAEPHLRELSHRTRETVIMSQLDRNAISVLECLEGPGPMRISYARGQALPNPATASAKALLAFGDPKLVQGVLKRRRLVRYTHRTITDPAAVKRELDRVRLLGYAVNRDEVDDGVSAIAVPVPVGRGPVRYAISLAMPSLRCTDAKVIDYSAAVLETARAVADDISACS